MNRSWAPPTRSSVLPNDRVVRACLVAVATQGVSHVTTQLVLLREMLTVYSGNELVIGVLLGCWLLLSPRGEFVDSV